MDFPSWGLPFISFQITCFGIVQRLHGSTNLKTFLNKWILILVLHDKCKQTVRCDTHLNNLIISNFTKEISKFDLSSPGKEPYF